MEPDDVPDLAAELHFLVGALVRQNRAVLPDREVTLSQISVLKRLEQDGPHSVAELARKDKITHQSVAATVAALVARDHVRREPDPVDLRRKSLVITEAGRALLNERRYAGSDHMAELLAARLDAAERQQLSRVLPLLRRLLD